MSAMLTGLQFFGQILEHELQQDVLRSQHQKEIEIAQMRAAIVRDQTSAQIEVAQLLVSAALHVFDRKADLIENSFREIVRGIDASIAELHNKEREADRRLPESKSGRLEIIASISEARKERIQLQRAKEQLMNDMFLFATTLNLQFSGSFPLIGNNK